MRVNLDSFEVQVRAEAVDEEPKVWKEIWIKYIVHGEVPEEELKKAIDLSYTTYCSVGAMLKKTAKVNYEYEIINGS
jgi:putative redox protein